MDVLSDPVVTTGLTETTWFQLLAAVAALGAAWAAVHRWLVVPCRDLGRQVHEFLEDWRGRPDRPGVQGHPGAMTRLAQLENNGGSSIKDLVERTVRQLERMDEQFGRHLDDVEHERAASKRVERELREAIGNLAEAIPLAVRASPPSPDEEGEG